MARGIVRKIDDVGRVVPPRAYLKTLGIKPGDPVDIYLLGNVICIESPKLQCVYCGDTNEKNHIGFKGVIMCVKCCSEIRNG